MTKPSKKRSKSVAMAKSKPLVPVTDEQKRQKEKDEQLKAELTTLQDRIKRFSELYLKEFKKHLD
jgi:hypothetical protein